MAKEITVLGIETSCDETASAVLRFDGKKLDVLSNVVASQIPLHRLTGGVVPEVAAREHVSAIIPTVKLALKKAGIEKEQLDGIAVTSGPGLLPALMVGVDTANAVSLALNIPVIPIQHISGHIYANFIAEEIILPKIKFPLLALVVSGGHTEFILAKDHLKFKKVGATLDDAVGEAFDKTAKILGLPYPGGPEISKISSKGNPDAFAFPRPLTNKPNLDFSFAGLKTSVLYKVQEIQASLRDGEQINQKMKADLAASAQKAIVETLVTKTRQALREHQAKSFMLGGGVSANRLLQKRMKNTLETEFSGIQYYPPITKYSTDNAAMIAAVGLVKLWKKEKLPATAQVNPRWEIKD